MYSERVKAWIKANYADAKLAYDALMKFYPFTLEDLDGEIWEWIHGYEGDYQESTFGRTKSFKRGKVKIMKPSLDSGGYLFVELHKTTNTHLPWDFTITQKEKIIITQSF